MISNSSLELNATKILPLSLDASSEISRFFSPNMVSINSHELKVMNEIIELTQKIFSNKHFENFFKLDSDSTHGLFCGYDFHLTTNGPKLIEINTNAGGALLNYSYFKNQKINPAINFLDFEKQVIEQFKNEWALSVFAKNKLNSICVLDDQPETQFLYPEFLLFQKLLNTKVAKTTIVDPSQLSLRQDGLYFEDEKVDFIYNRLTDFYFTQSHHLHLRTAYENKLCLFSPSPHHHARYANKEIFVHLSKNDFLKNCQLSETEVKTVQKMIPTTTKVSSENKNQLWNDRKKLFFKPTMGHGSKGVYRGDKITHKVFDEIMQEQYIAQEYIPAPLKITTDGAQKNYLKFDIRLYTYAGYAFLAAARLFEGQATNFRTAGGGFAPVILV